MPKNELFQWSWGGWSSNHQFWGCPSESSIDVDNSFLKTLQIFWCDFFALLLQKKHTELNFVLTQFHAHCLLTAEEQERKTLCSCLWNFCMKRCWQGSQICIFYFVLFLTQDATEVTVIGNSKPQFKKNCWNVEHSCWSHLHITLSKRWPNPESHCHHCCLSIVSCFILSTHCVQWF